MTGPVHAAQRATRGGRAHLSGQAAEEAAARRYAGAGCAILDRRWRGAAGEIDLVARDGATIVFVEVKRAASHARAAERLTARQRGRLCAAAEEYLGRMSHGLLTEMRFDVALVNGTGEVAVLENAFGAA
ncbi:MULTISPECIES: YraN family protein [unclassified Rhodosalinus]|uniref:YraN family protein n=1 Tax=unclassified Rhodosalinus TaxID=2630183 RepID=UPI0035242C70